MRAYHWMVLVLMLCFGVPLQAAEDPQSGPIMVPNPAADLWRAVRQRGDQPVPARSQVQGLDSSELINVNGQRFREYRRERFIRIAGYTLAGTFLLILLFHAIHGGLDHERTGRRIPRFELPDRVAHWLLASIFLFLALTGLTLLFGRFVLIPWLGAEAFSPIASASKEGHNLFGPLFIVALGWVFLRFVSRNLPSRGDLVWLLRGGGLLGNSHPPAGFFNAGEKIWFWLLSLGGLALILSGLLLDFPFLAPSRDGEILALVVHGLAAILLIVFMFGHVYVGTIGVKGSLDSMTEGHVDEGWARNHHSLWYEEVKGLAEPEADREDEQLKTGLAEEAK